MLNQTREGLDQRYQRRNDGEKLQMMTTGKADSDFDMEYDSFDSEDINMNHVYPKNMIPSKIMRPPETKRYVQRYERGGHTSPRSDIRDFVDATKLNALNPGAYLPLPEQFYSWEMPAESTVPLVTHEMQRRPRSAPKERMIAHGEYPSPRDVVQTNIAHPRVKSDTDYSQRYPDDVYDERRIAQLKHRIKIGNHERRQKQWRGNRPKMQKSISFDVSSLPINANDEEDRTTISQGNIYDDRDSSYVNSDNYRMQMMLQNGFRPVRHRDKSGRRWVGKHQTTDEISREAIVNPNAKRSFRTVSPRDYQRSASAFLSSEYCDDPGLLDIPNLSPGYEDFCDIYYEEEIENHGTVKPREPTKFDSLLVNVSEDQNDDRSSSSPIEPYPVDAAAGVSGDLNEKHRIKRQGMGNTTGPYIERDLLQRPVSRPGSVNDPGSRRGSANDNLNRSTTHENVQQDHNCVNMTQRRGSARNLSSNNSSHLDSPRQPKLTLTDAEQLDKGRRKQLASPSPREMNSLKTSSTKNDISWHSMVENIERPVRNQELVRSKSYHKQNQKDATSEPDSQFKNRGFWFHFNSSAGLKPETQQPREEEVDDEDMRRRSKGTKHKTKTRNKEKPKDSPEDRCKKKVKKIKKEKKSKAKIVANVEKDTKYNKELQEETKVVENEEKVRLEQIAFDATEELQLVRQTDNKQKEDLGVFSKQQQDDLMKKRLLELAEGNGSKKLHKSNQTEGIPREIVQSSTSSQADVIRDVTSDAQTVSYAGFQTGKMLKRSKTVGCFPVDSFCVHCRRLYLSSFCNSFHKQDYPNPKAKVYVQYARKLRSFSISHEEVEMTGRRLSVAPHQTRPIENDQTKNLQKTLVPKGRRKQGRGTDLELILEETKRSRRKSEHKAGRTLKTVMKNDGENNKMQNKEYQSACPLKPSKKNTDDLVISDEEKKKSVIANLIRRRQTKNKNVEESVALAESNAKYNDLNNHEYQLESKKKIKYDNVKDQDKVEFRNRLETIIANSPSRSDAAKRGREEEEVISDEENKKMLISNLIRKKKEAIERKSSPRGDVMIHNQKEKAVVSDEDRKRKLISNLIRKKKETCTKQSAKKICNKDEKKENVISDEEKKKIILGNIIRKKRAKAADEQQKSVGNVDRPVIIHKEEVSNEKGHEEKLGKKGNKVKRIGKENDRFTETTALKANIQEKDVAREDTSHNKRLKREHKKENVRKTSKGFQYHDTSNNQNIQPGNLYGELNRRPVENGHADGRMENGLQKFDKTKPRNNHKIDIIKPEARNTDSKSSSNDESSCSESSELDSSINESIDDADHSDAVSQSSDEDSSDSDEDEVDQTDDEEDDSENASLVLDLASIDDCQESYSSSEESEESDEQTDNDKHEEHDTASGEEAGENLTDDTEEQTESSEETSSEEDGDTSEASSSA